jgi:hypothetical protein
LNEIEPEPFVEIHPEKAEEFGIKSGEYVIVESVRGGIKVKAKITKATLQNVVFITPGWAQPYSNSEMVDTNLLTDENSHMKLAMFSQGTSCANEEQNSQEFDVGEGEFASVVIWKSVKRHIRDKDFSAADKSKRQVEESQRQYITSIGGEANHQPTYFSKVDSGYRFRAPHEDLP